MTRALGIAVAIALAFVPFLWPAAGVLAAVVVVVYVVTLACGTSAPDDGETDA